MTSSNDPQGALWRRWDPHIHAPGTILNDQYGKKSWDEFLRRIESADPPIQALGITDYYSLDCYEEVLEKQREGRLSEVGLIFPNIEMRYGIGTGKGNCRERDGPMHSLCELSRDRRVITVKHAKQRCKGA